ncbi:CLUMA_CG006801, isoform A [Clunio marinus]|uniref:CLUMA_CG006801, isoform A n=1 Tax=Clunio marinus TaxID=568069 RepID=A0A1J1I0E8_9DIPT|nr:CLUMA_CG006801, isoform A [Clunio marinus]
MTTMMVWISHMAFIVIGSDSFFILTTVHTMSEASVCGHLVSKIGRNTDDKYLNDLIERHLHVLDLIESSNTIFSVINFCQLISAFLMIVAALFQLNSVVDAVSLLIIVAILSQNFVYCFLGTCIETSCEQLEQSLYCSQWYNLRNVSLKRKFLMMLVMSQRKRGYFAIGIKPMSLETHAELLKAAFSFLNVLLTML